MYYCQQWLDESHDRVPPHRDMEVIRERKKKCFERYFSSEVERRRAMRSMLLFLHAWKIFLVMIPSMTGGT